VRNGDDVATGDLRLEGRGSIGRPGLAAAAGLVVHLPTASGDFAGGRLVVEPLLIGELAWARLGLRFGASVGLPMGEERVFFDTHVGPVALRAGGAVEWAARWPWSLKRF